MITLVMAYFNNGGMLDIHLREWSKYQDKDKWKIILVDDCSQRDPAISHLIEVGIPIELYRIRTDRPWNQNGARNLGMTHAQGWCLLTDMDHLLNVKEAEKLQAADLMPGRYYRPLRCRQVDGNLYKQHPNTWILQSADYWKAGGYDERYCGYYGTDSTFRRQLEKAHGKPLNLDVTLMLYGREVQEDASTTDYGRKDSKYYLKNLPKKGRELSPTPMLNFQWERLR